MFFQNLNNLVQPKLCWVTKTCSTRPAMFTDITSEFGGARIRTQWSKLQQPPQFHLLSCSMKQIVFGAFLINRNHSDWCSVPRNIGKCLVARLGCHRIFKLRFETSWVKTFQGKRLVWTASSLATSFPLPSPLYIFFWDYTRSRFTHHHCPLICWYDLLRLQFHPSCLQMSSLNLNTGITCAGMLTVPSFNICKLLGVCPKIFHHIM
jgi:hypothetical protein